MVRILDNPNKKEFVAVCKLCSCKFIFDKTELHYLPNRGDFVWCPNCKHQVAIEQLIEYKRPEPKSITAGNQEWAKR